MLPPPTYTCVTPPVTGSPPRFASQHPNVYIFETDENGDQQDLILPCPIDSPSPTVEYTWFRGNEQLPEAMVNQGGSLVVANITEGEFASREGVEYYCVARDNLGYVAAVRSRTITVFYACESFNLIYCHQESIIRGKRVSNMHRELACVECV